MCVCVSVCLCVCVSVSELLRNGSTDFDENWYTDTSRPGECPYLYGVTHRLTCPGLEGVKAGKGVVLGFRGKIRAGKTNKSCRA